MKLRHLLLATFILALSASVASAAPPTAPQRIGVVGGDNQNGTLSAYLSWFNMDSSSSENITRYNIYLSTDGGTTYDLYDTLGVVGDSSYVYSSYNYITSTEGEYYFYVTAVNADGESSSSGSVSVTLAFRPVRMTEKVWYADSALLGSEYAFDFDAVTANPNESVRFSVVTGNIGGNPNPYIDSLTGEFSWIPTEVGQVWFTVYARLASDPTKLDSSLFYLSVIDPDRIYFTSWVLGARVDSGQTVQHTFQAVGPQGVTLTYGLLTMSNSSNIDVSLDPNTGEIELTPHAYGTYQFEVAVYADNDTTPRATQGGSVVASDPTLLDVYLSGAVIDSLHELVPSTVYAYRRTGTSPLTYTQVDSQGVYSYYSFRNLPGGHYILYAVPDDTNHAAGYYRENDYAALTWDNATVMTGTGTFDTTVIMLPMIDGAGSNRLRGGVTRSSGRAGLRDRSLGSAETPLEGATVYAIDATGRIQGMDVTDTKGEYEINRLGTGTFTVLVDRIGFTADAGTVTFTEDNGTVKDIDVHAEPANSTSGVVMNPVRVERARVAPTPTSGEGLLRFEGVAGAAELTVQSTDGRTVQRMSLTTTPGSNLVVLQTEGLQAGSYIVRIAMPNRMVTAPLVIVR